VVHVQRQNEGVVVSNEDERLEQEGENKLKRAEEERKGVCSLFIFVLLSTVVFEEGQDAQRMTSPNKEDGAQTTPKGSQAKRGVKRKRLFARERMYLILNIILLLFLCFNLTNIYIYIYSSARDDVRLWVSGRYKTNSN